MAIPGMKPVYDVRGKIRVGAKTETVKNGKTIEFPKSLDHFVSDDPGFNNGARPTSLIVTFPFEKAEDNFSTGLEWWEGKLLVCYAKGEEIGGKPVAFRRASMKQKGQTLDLLEGENILNPETVGTDRKRIECLSRGCSKMKAKSCKPMGRLQFWIEGYDPADGVWQIDTKAWNSIEKIEGFLAQQGDCRGKRFKLVVKMEQSGTKKFPVIHLERLEVEVNSPKDAALADACIALHKVLDGGTEQDVKVALVVVLDITTPNWRGNEALIDKLKEVGAVNAAKSMLEKLGL